ncbi:uncharacterized protein LOC130361355 [Hyla sarda]|uniref:uncharacterized protein LOC130361355 n=1 Tax=Hyla sarda TaxID=327740 RepID=UPI0024C38BEE|nr:uncharacterized protein LOC130361355 [Hyla sarda]
MDKFVHKGPQGPAVSGLHASPAPSGPPRPPTPQHETTNGASISAAMEVTGSQLLFSQLAESPGLGVQLSDAMAAGPSVGGLPAHPDLQALAAALVSLITPTIQKTLENTIRDTLTQIRTDLGAQEGRIGEMEHRIVALEDENSGLATKLRQMDTDLCYVSGKLEDLENRSRRSNLRLVGVTESLLPADLQDFCKSDLPKALGLPHKCRVERAHRIGKLPDRNVASKAGVDSHPRQVIFKLLDYNDKVSILRAFRKRTTPLTFRNKKMLIFEDFSADVAKRRKAFSNVCTALYNAKRRFQLQYPATLKVHMPDGSFRSYQTPSAAEAELRDVLADHQRHPRHSPARQDPSRDQGPLAQRPARRKEGRDRSPAEGRKRKKSPKRRSRSRSSRSSSPD